MKSSQRRVEAGTEAGDELLQVEKASFDRRTCSDWELLECWYWEFKRELKHTIGQVFCWRENYPQAKTFDAFFSLIRLIPVRPQDGHLYGISPEWPLYPFCSIPPAERRRRLTLLFPGEQEALADTLDPRQPEIRQVSHVDAVRGEWHIAENVPIHIDWQRSDTELLRSFEAWLKKNRKHRSTQNLSARALRADLKALAALRLFKAGQWKESRLFDAQGEWIKARKRALSILAEL
jgi:hypothetical protein